MTLPLRARLTILHVTVMSLVLLTAAVVLPLGLSAQLSDRVDQSLVDRATQLSADYQKEGDAEFIENANGALSGLVGTVSWAQLLATDGHVIKSAGDRAGGPVLDAGVIRSALDGQHVLLTTDMGSGAGQYRVIVRSLGDPDSKVVLLLGTSMDTTSEAVSQLIQLVIVVATLAAIAAGVGVWWMSRLALAPLRNISSRAAKINVERLDDRLPQPATRDEVGDLTVTLNAMFDRLREGVEQQRRMIADTSHELRTPLAIMRAELDAALTVAALPDVAASALQRNAEEVDRMARIVANLLMLARIDQGQLELFRQLIDLREEAITVMARFSALAAEKGLAIRVEGCAQQAELDRERIDQVLTNLVDNAVKYAAGGEITILVWRRDGEVGVTVSDTGSGLPDHEAERVFDRFYRVDPARSGSPAGAGLGLAISREIIRAHGGRIWAETAPSRFSFVLPA